MSALPNLTDLEAEWAEFMHDRPGGRNKWSLDQKWRVDNPAKLTKLLDYRSGGARPDEFETTEQGSPERRMLRHLDAWLKAKGTPTPAPGYTVRSSIQDGALTGSVPWEGTPSDPAVTARVEFLIDGTVRHTETAAPYVYGGDGAKLDTATLADGGHTLLVRATAADGVVATDSATVTVQNDGEPDPGPTPGPVDESPLGFMRYQGLKLQSHPGDYSMRILSGLYADPSYAQYPPTIKYVAMWHTYSDARNGMTTDEARANGWLLKNSDGVELFMGGWGTYMLDIGNPACRQRWAELVEGQMRQWGYGGVMNDDCQSGVTSYVTNTQNRFPAKYPNEAAMYAQVVAMCKHMGEQMRPEFTIMHNAGRWIAGDGRSDQMYWTKLMYGDIGPYSDYVMYERFMVADQTTTANADRLRRMGNEWFNHWDKHLSLIPATYANGMKPFPLTYATSPNAPGANALARETYAMASFLLEYDPSKGGAFCWHINKDTDPWTPLHDKLLALGAPTGAKSLSGNTWSRSFEHGRVTVDPVAATATIT